MRTDAGETIDCETFPGVSRFPFSLRKTYFTNGPNNKLFTLIFCF